MKKYKITKIKNYKNKNVKDMWSNNLSLIKLIIKIIIKLLINYFVNMYTVEKTIETLFTSIINLIKLEISPDQKFILNLFYIKDIMHYYYSEVLRPLLRIIFVFYNKYEFGKQNYKELLVSYRKNKNNMVILWLIKSPWRPLAIALVRRMEEKLNFYSYGNEIHKKTRKIR